MNQKEIDRETAFARVVRDFRVGHTTQPIRLVGISFDVENNAGTLKETIRFVIDPAEVPELIRQLQVAMKTAAQ